LKTALIFSGGSAIGNEYLPCNYDLIVSADGGYLNALKFNLVPNICMGDFDTLTTTTRIHPTCETIEFPPEKDDTDTMLCIKKAISMGCDTIYLYGATGGRFDHTLANLQALNYMLNRDINAYIVDTQNVITVQKESTRVYKALDNFKYFSILALTDSVTVSARGLKYPLKYTTLTNDFPLGVSNEILTTHVDLTVHKGKAYVIYSKDRDI
jgi:thiamine pyrophosphokinase